MHFLKCSFLILFAFIFLKDTQGARIINSIVAKNKTEVIDEYKNKDIIAHLIGEINALKERVGDLEKYRKLAQNEESGIIENHYTGQEFLPDSCKYEIQWSRKSLRSKRDKKKTFLYRSKNIGAHLWR